MNIKKLWKWCKALCVISTFLWITKIIYFTKAYGWHWEPISEAEIVFGIIVRVLTIIAVSLFSVVVAVVINILLNEEEKK